MYCLQWLIPVLLIPKHWLHPTFLIDQAIFMWFYVIGFFMERRLVFSLCLFFFTYTWAAHIEINRAPGARMQMSARSAFYSGLLSYGWCPKASLRYSEGGHASNFAVFNFFEEPNLPIQWLDSIAPRHNPSLLPWFQHFWRMSDRYESNKPILALRHIPCAINLQYRWSGATGSSVLLSEPEAIKNRHRGKPKTHEGDSYFAY